MSYCFPVRDMGCPSPAETRRETIHGGSMPASMRATVSAGEGQPMFLELVGL